MPRCLTCGNTISFSSSAVPASPAVHGAVSGLAAHFGEDGAVKILENRGVPVEELQVAAHTPESYFDTCNYCGSQNILWP